MINHHKVSVVQLAYSAERIPRQTVAEISGDTADDIMLTDDANGDNTVAVARSLGLHTPQHHRNRGYGGNQMTCSRAVLDRSINVVMLHPEYWYTHRLVTGMVSMVASDQFRRFVARVVRPAAALLGEDLAS